MAKTRYLRRVVDQQLDDTYGELPAVAIDGPKGVGKTATATRRARTVLTLDDPAHRDLLLADPTVLDRLPGPILIDEWQREPRVWDFVRRSVDANPVPGRFLLTGSAAPVTHPTHSGAGRIVRLRMRPMTLAERGVWQPTVSVTELLDGDRPDVSGRGEATLPDYAREIVRSGLPGLRRMSAAGARLSLDGYLDQIAERDFEDQGVRLRQPGTLTAWLRAYAGATATTTSFEKLIDAATPGHEFRLSRAQAALYRDVLQRLWLVDEVPTWTPLLTGVPRRTDAPKHHLTDPALAARLLGVTERTLIKPAGPGLADSRPRTGAVLGVLFESLVTASVRVYAAAAQARTFHLRTKGGEREVDLILQRDDGRVLAVEVKLATTVDDDDVKHLHWLSDLIGDDLIDAVVVTTGEYAYRRPDGIAVVPACLLGP